MARLFVHNDNLTARVEIMSDDSEEGAYVAHCVGHATGRGLDADSLVANTHERFSLEDTIRAASIHVDHCTRCADDGCRNPDRHDRGRRCRKES